MKQYILRGLLIAGAAFLIVPVVSAQQEKEKKSKGMETITIVRDEDANAKTVIEIEGDKIRINGKDVKEGKNDGVSVRRSRYKTGNAYSYTYNGDRISLFDEDENRAMLGVNTRTSSEDKVEGAKITSVVEGSAADKAGLKAGDIVTKVDDKKIDENNSITDVIRNKKPGDKISVTFLRDGKEEKITAELGKWKGLKATPLPGAGAWNIAPRIDPGDFNFDVHGGGIYFGGPKLGLQVQDSEDGKGVKVLEVDEDGNAAKAGIKENDIITSINDKEVNSADALAKEVKTNKNSPTVKFNVLRSGKSQTIEVKIPRKLKTADL